MKPFNNIITIAAAGSGKTTRIVEETEKLCNKKILITTYTNENTEQIKTFLYAKYGYIPNNITILSWYSFLLRDGVRPFQNFLGFEKRIESMAWVNKHKFHKKNDFLTPMGRIYRDKVAEFVYECDKASQGAIIKRLEKIYDYIFIDELQDLTGYDLEVLYLLFNSQISIRGVGDPRQAILRTNLSTKNKQYVRAGILLWLKKHEKSGLISISELNKCYRSNQKICEFASNIFPQFSPMSSAHIYKSKHEGVFVIPYSQIPSYIQSYHPTILRKWIKTNTQNYSAHNIGTVKGKTFDRVLIFPTATMLNAVKNKSFINFEEKELLYVAVTRARHSVAFADTSRKNNKIQE